MIKKVRENINKTTFSIGNIDFYFTLLVNARGVFGAVFINTSCAGFYLSQVRDASKHEFANIFIDRFKTKYLIEWNKCVSMGVVKNKLEQIWWFKLKIKLPGTAFE